MNVAVFRNCGFCGRSDEVVTQAYDCSDQKAVKLPPQYANCERSSNKQSFRNYGNADCAARKESNFERADFIATEVIDIKQICEKRFDFLDKVVEAHVHDGHSLLG